MAMRPAARSSTPTDVTLDESKPPLTNTIRAPRSSELGVVAVLAADVGDLGGDEQHRLDPALEQHVDVADLAHRRARGVAEDRGEAGVRGARVSIAWASAANTGLPNSGTSRPIAPPLVTRPGGT